MAVSVSGPSATWLSASLALPVSQVPQSDSQSDEMSRYCCVTGHATVTLPSRYRHATVTLPLLHGHTTVTRPLRGGQSPVSHVSQSTEEQSMARSAHQPQKKALKSAVVSVVYLKWAMYACDGEHRE